ncbi:Autophagy-related protein 18h [Vitis vinifera]|uniref:Autophagy-related protein 18h n=1 Tax=Vitis vinifera TaxID=29760 RepID=A0A438F043_VITVI|nr:Autophagy-related protein 18h [Vitis vinifera]
MHLHQLEIRVKGLELGPSNFKHVLLLGYSNGFQVLDVEDSSNVSELVSRRDDPVTFLQMQPIPAKSEGREGFRASHPLLLVVAGNVVNSPTAVRFYSLRSHNYVHVLRFRSTVYMVRCSPRIVAVGLATQIYCFDALTLENKFSVLTYPVPQLGGQGLAGVNIGYGPMDVGLRWLAYASNNPLLSNMGRLSPQSLTPSPGVSPSTSPSSGSLVARYAMESSKQLAAGIINLGDMGYKTLSKYCQELRPDGSSSPVSSHSSWKVGRVASHSNETDSAGMVVVKDFVSRAVVSQFRAHTSPISALCFDPSGTVLVTASIHGNNINIFRIMPSCSQNASGYDWNASHVHLYKLHRGMTSAVIQDICFSHYSQWIAIVSSKGTCHIFVLSPFGGESGLQIQNSHVRSSSCQFYLYHGVSNVASSAAGKVSVPSGAVAAVFHSSVPHDLLPAHLKVNALEHLLVYTPSGHVIQYELLPSMGGGEPSETASGTGSGSLVQVQDEELRVKVEPVQWWDVCRGMAWPEREECIAGIMHGRQETVVMDTSDCEDNDTGEMDLVKPHERLHWYLSNAEVQIRSGRIPIWQKSKIYFFTMDPLVSDECNFTKILVERLKSRSFLFKRDLSRGISPSSSSEPHGAKEKFSEGVANPQSKLVVPGSVGNTDGGPPSKDETPCDLNQMNTVKTSSHIIQTVKENGVKSGSGILAPSLPNHGPFNRDSVSGSPKQMMGISPIEDSYFVNSISSIKNGSLSSARTIGKEVESSDSVGTSEASNTSSNRSDSSMNILDEGPVEPLYFGQYFQEGYCKASTLDECRELTEVTDVDSGSSPCDREKSEEDENNDDMLGGVFAFSEEGTRFTSYIFTLMTSNTLL